MPVIRINDFQGTVPAVEPRNLSPKHAQTAHNLDLTSQTLRPSYNSALIAILAGVDPQTIFRFDDTTWFEWDADVDAVRSVVANDAYDRVYFTGVTDEAGTFPRVTDADYAVSGAPPYPSASYRMGVPAPVGALTASVTGSGTGPIDTRFYVATLVDKYGAEGPPCTPAGPYDYQDGQTITLSGAAMSLPNAPYDLTNWKYRLYRSNTVGTDSVFQFVLEGNITGSSPGDLTGIVDDVTSAELGEPLPSADWDPPPDDLVGLRSVPGGYLVGFRGNELLASEVGLPHAWPVKYRRSVDYRIVAVASMARGVFIGTEGQPYVAIGSSPGSLALPKLPIPYACLNKTGVVEIRGSVVYPSPLGLVLVGDGANGLITQRLFTREQWEAMNPSTIRAYEWRGRYLAFYTANNTISAFTIDPFHPEQGILTYSGLNTVAGYQDLNDGRLYVAYGGNIAQWDSTASAKLTYTWKSRPFVMPKPHPMRVVQVFADEYPVELSVYRDGVIQSRALVSSPEPVRVFNSAIGREYELEVVSTKEVREILLASSVSELAKV